MLKKILTDWVTDYKDAAERNALAEDPNESAEYLVSLFKAEVDKLTVIDYEKLRIMTGISFSDKAKLDIDDLLEAQLYDTKKQLLDLMGE